LKKLNELFDCSYDVIIKGIKINSKEVEPGDLFVCTMGVTVDRHDFIDEAVQKGAVAIVVSRDVEANVPVIKVKNTNEELSNICAKFYDHPEKKLKIIGVTGTDGKTSTATIIQTLLGMDICGYIGTNGRRCSKFDKEINNTTPDSDKLYEYFYDFVQAGCKYVVMEASSEAFFRKRIDDISFDGGVITNITKEHLNIHKTFANYIDCKAQLFRQIKDNGFSILNNDDLEVDYVYQACHTDVLTYGKKENSTLCIKNINIRSYETNFDFSYNGKMYTLNSPLLGEFNVYNLCAGILCCLSLGLDMENIVSKINEIKISGRLELLPYVGQNFKIMIDYAHTPNGITNLLNFVHTLNFNRSIVVIGSAGERDYLKRPIMGKCVADNADYVIFTYEDPRSEDPLDIINMMISEIKNYSNYEVVVDRSQAIKRAIDIASDNDIVLILGKGNETYQKLKDKVIYFNDFEEAKKHLNEKLEKEKSVV